MIGSKLARRLAGVGHRVIVVDNLWRGKKEYLLDEHGKAVIDLEEDLHVLDLTVPGQIDALLDGVDYVYHLAAEGHVSATSQEALRRFTRVNVGGTKNIISRTHQRIHTIMIPKL